MAIFFIFISTHHAGPGLVPDEGVPEHLRELARPEGEVRPLTAQRADALLQRQQRLVDLGALHPRLPVGRARVRAPLVARKVDQRELAEQRLLVVVHSQDDLKQRL